MLELAFRSLSSISGRSLVRAAARRERVMDGGIFCSPSTGSSNTSAGTSHATSARTPAFLARRSRCMSPAPSSRNSREQEEAWKVLGRQVLLRESREHRCIATAAMPNCPRITTAMRWTSICWRLRITSQAGDPVERELIEVATRLAGFCRGIASDDGRLPTIGDDDGGQLFPICARGADDVSSSLAISAALLAGQNWRSALRLRKRIGSAANRRIHLTTDGRPHSTVFRDTGYAVLRSANGQAIVDVGRHGFLNGGHAHADALSIVLSVNRLPLLVDPAPRRPRMNAEIRDRFRASAMHGSRRSVAAQSVPAGPFHWRSRADASLTLCAATRAPDFVEASHAAYAPLEHRRVVARTPDLRLVADRVDGEGTHQLRPTGTSIPPGPWIPLLGRRRSMPSIPRALLQQSRRPLRTRNSSLPIPPDTGG